MAGSQLGTRPPFPTGHTPCRAWPTTPMAIAAKAPASRSPSPTETLRRIAPASRWSRSGLKPQSTSCAPSIERRTSSPVQSVSHNTGYAPYLRTRVSPPAAQIHSSVPDSSQTHLVQSGPDVWSCHSALRSPLLRYPPTARRGHTASRDPEPLQQSCVRRCCAFPASPCLRRAPGSPFRGSHRVHPFRPAQIAHLRPPLSTFADPPFDAPRFDAPPYMHREQEAYGTSSGRPRATCQRYRSGVSCLLYTSDAADDLLCVDLGGRRI